MALASFSPTSIPTLRPTIAPTYSVPTSGPTTSPTFSVPTVHQTMSPTSSYSTGSPTIAPTISLLTDNPTSSPTASPTLSSQSTPPFLSPSIPPTTLFASLAPTLSPTSSIPTSFPSGAPTSANPVATAAPTAVRGRELLSPCRPRDDPVLTLTTQAALNKSGECVDLVLDCATIISAHGCSGQFGNGSMILPGRDVNIVCRSSCNTLPFCEPYCEDEADGNGVALIIVAVLFAIGVLFALAFAIHTLFPVATNGKIRKVARVFRSDAILIMAVPVKELSVPDYCIKCWSSFTVLCAYFTCCQCMRICRSGVCATLYYYCGWGCLESCNAAQAEIEDNRDKIYKEHKFDPIDVALATKVEIDTDFGKFSAVIKYVGYHVTSNEPIVGVEVQDGPVWISETANGKLDGRRYFKGEKGRSFVLGHERVTKSEWVPEVVQSPLVNAAHVSISGLEADEMCSI